VFQSLHEFKLRSFQLLKGSATVGDLKKRAGISGSSPALHQ